MSEELNLRKIDGKIAHHFNFYWNVRTVSVCPDCGHENDDDNGYFRCPACLANGDRVALSDPQAVWSFRPSSKYDDTKSLLKRLSKEYDVTIRFHGDKVICYIESVDFKVKEISESLELAVALATVKLINTQIGE